MKMFSNVVDVASNIEIGLSSANFVGSVTFDDGRTILIFQYFWHVPFFSDRLIKCMIGLIALQSLLTPNSSEFDIIYIISFIHLLNLFHSHAKN